MPFQKRVETEPWKTINYWFRNYPLTTPIFLLISVVVTGLSILAEEAFGIVFMVVSSIVYIYIVARYIIIGYRIFSRRVAAIGGGGGLKTGILAIIDLKLAEFLTIAGVITGMYLIDTTPGKTKYITHPEFSASANPYEAWAYIISVSVFVISSTGFASILEAHLAASLVFAVGVAIAQISNLVIVASVVGYWAEKIQDNITKRRREKKKRMKKSSQ